ncbi:MAG: tetratricopeptide repeat protein [Spirochaetaceae bacterium]|nr:tetratricopeptide repeat protein [Spirochaetaceae bacterium]
MNLLFVVLLLLVIALCFHFYVSSSPKKEQHKEDFSDSGPIHVKNRERIIANCKKKLSKNPQNYEALRDLAGLYFTEEDYIQALPLYELIFSLPDGQTHIDFPICAMNLGITAANLHQNTVALRALEYAIARIPENFELCLTLANLSYEIGDLTKAIVYYEEALKLQPTDIPSQIGIAQCRYKSQDYKKAIPILQLLIDDNLGKPELTFMLADSLYATGNPNVSERYFQQLYDDPVFGVKASLALGDIARMNSNFKLSYDCYCHGLDLTKTIETDQGVMLALLYNMGQCCLQMKNISKGLELFFRVRDINPDYKNVNDIISSYEEINRNKNLCIYTIGSQDAFSKLCHTIVFSFFKTCVKKVMATDINSDYVEVIVQVTDPSSWEDIMVFRFYRSKSPVGELAVRDLYGKTHEVHAGRAFCFVLESFTEGAIKFCDGRQVVLYDRDKLVDVLNKLPPIATDDENEPKIGEVSDIKSESVYPKKEVASPVSESEEEPPAEASQSPKDLDEVDMAMEA